MDIKNLTLGEIATVERISGQPLVALSDEKAFKGELLAALAFVIKKRSSPSFTIEDAQALTMDDIEDILSDGDAPEKKE